ncbi:MAG: DoxX family membrane protein [Minisyncoccia bacterium]
MFYLFILGRIILGGYFIMSGVNHFRHLKMLAGYAESKKVPMASTAVWFTGLMMLLGGLGILLGVWIEFSVLLLSVFLLVTTLMMHQYWTVSEPGAKMSEQINFMKNMALLGAVLMLLAIPLPWAAALF